MESKQITTETKLEAMTIATELKTGEEVPWSRIIKCFANISDEKNKHRSYKAYKVLDYYNDNQEEIIKLFLEKLEYDQKKARERCGINI